MVDDDGEVERTANPATDDKPWPGAVIVATDTHLDDTYRDGEDHGFPVAVSVAQLATIVSESAAPGEAEEMIKSATTELMSGALLRRAARLPTEAAVALIDGIGAHGAEPVDVQLTLDEVLLHEDALAGSRTQINGAIRQALATRAAANRAVLSEHRQRSDRHEKHARSTPPLIDNNELTPTHVTARPSSSSQPHGTRSPSRPDSEHSKATAIKPS